MIDWTDRRPIDTMPFGAEAPEMLRAETVERVRKILRACGCETADDIVKLGCTGVAAHTAAVVGDDPSQRFHTDELVIEAGQFLRLGLAGGGVGLPCFVPPDRYCLIHQTTGGLQDGQEQRHVDFVNAVSRELTPAERATAAMVESARRVKGVDAASELLTGWKRGEAVKLVKERLENDAVGELPVESPVGAAPVPMGVSFIRPVNDVPEAAPWKCHEHKKTNWKCRYCLAQAVVEGALEPAYSMTFDASDEQNAAGMTADEMEARLTKLNETGIPCVDVYVHAMRFTRKLSRD